MTRKAPPSRSVSLSEKDLDGVVGGANISGSGKVDGTFGDDAICGQDGDDTLNGAGGDDVIWGGNGDDVINGGAGNDVLNGSQGNDSVNGGAGNDVVFTYAGEGNDTVHGGNGMDILAIDGRLGGFVIFWESGGFVSPSDANVMSDGAPITAALQPGSVGRIEFDTGGSVDFDGFEGVMIKFS